MKNIIFFSAILFFTVNVFAQNTYQGKLGYGFSPEGFPFDFSQADSFYQEVANTCDGGIVFANSNWRDSDSSSGIIPNFQKTISSLQPSPHGYVDMVNFGWATYPVLYLNVPDNNTNNWTNADAKNLFLQMLINFSDSLQPAYLFIGNEINFYFEQDSIDYLNFVSFFEQAHDSIKAHSPNTKVGTTFNYEDLAGVGTLNNWTIPHWNALTAFDSSKIDVLGITLYPFFSYATANAVPLTYLDPLFSRWGNKAVVFTETGWPADSMVGVWSSSPQQQVDYVNKLFAMIDGKNVEAINWLFLYYLMDYSSLSNKIFCSIAMKDSLGNDRPALSVWQSYCSTNGIKNLIGEQIPDVKIFPNPFSNQTTIQYSLPSRIFGTQIKIELYNLLGQKIKTIADEKQSSGEHKYSMDLEKENSAIYLLKIKTGENIYSKKIIKFE